MFIPSFNNLTISIVNKVIKSREQSLDNFLQGQKPIKLAHNIYLSIMRALLFLKSLSTTLQNEVLQFHLGSNVTFLDSFSR